MGQAKDRGSREQREQQAKDRGIQLPPIPVELLSALFKKGAAAEAALGPDADYNDAVAAFSTAVQEDTRGDLSEVERVTAGMRALAVFLMVTEEATPLISAGLINQDARGMEIANSLFWSAAVSPIAIKPFNESSAGAQVRFTYDINEVITNAKHAPAGKLQLPNGGVSQSMSREMLSVLEGMFAGAAPGMTLGEHLDAAAGVDAPVPTYDLADYPEYAAILRTRALMLPSIPVGDRNVFENETSRRSRAGAVIMMAGLELLMPGASKMMGAGPWDGFERLDSGAAWNFDRYFAAVSRSPAAFAIPDHWGWTPVFYTALHGKREHLQAVLQAAPMSVTIPDASGRYCLFEATDRLDAGWVFEMLLEAGADPDAGTPMGHTPFGNAVRRMNFEAIEHLLEWGADPYLDLAVRPAAMLQAAQDKKCPIGLRVALSDLANEYPVEKLRDLDSLYASAAESAEMLKHKVGNR